MGIFPINVFVEINAFFFNNHPKEIISSNVFVIVSEKRPVKLSQKYMYIKSTKVFITLRDIQSKVVPYVKK